MDCQESCPADLVVQDNGEIHDSFLIGTMNGVVFIMLMIFILLAAGFLYVIIYGPKNKNKEGTIQINRPQIV